MSASTRIKRLLIEAKRSMDEGDYASPAHQERLICETLGVKYDFGKHDLIFVAYYLGEINIEQLIGGISE